MLAKRIQLGPLISASLFLLWFCGGTRCCEFRPAQLQHRTSRYFFFVHRACILTDAGESKVEFRGPIDVREARVSSRPLDAGCNRSCVFLTPLHLIAYLIGRGSPFFPTSERHSRALLLLCGRAWTRVHVLSPSVLSLLSLSPLFLSPSIPSSLVVFGTGEAAPLRDDGLVCVFGYLAV